MFVSTYQPRHRRPTTSHYRARVVGPAAGLVALSALAIAPGAVALETPIDSDSEPVVVVSATPTTPLADTDGDATGSEVATDPAPVDPAPSDPAPADPVPTDPAPADPAPVDPAPADPVPSDPTPTDPAPTDPAPSDPAPSDPAPSDPAPSDPAPSDPDPSPSPSDPAEPAPGEPGEPAPDNPAPPGSVVDPGTTPVDEVDEGDFVPGEAAPAGSTWVVPDGAGRYVAVAGYEPGARLAQTGVDSLVWAIVSAGLVTGGGLMVAAHRRRGRHAA